MILVTGGAGVIGSRLVRGLLEAGNEVGYETVGFRESLARLGHPASKA
jgi:nucleoside-diphosphate-sugar epimerase